MNLDGVGAEPDRQEHQELLMVSSGYTRLSGPPPGTVRLTPDSALS